MPGIIDARSRHERMAAIRKRDTAPELRVRRALHAAGLRFRLHRADLPGTPDIVLPRCRVAILVHGCFWHQHPGCRLARRPRGNREYWDPKLARNVARDAATRDALTALGWRVIVVWECETRSAARLGELVGGLAASRDAAA
jgi:DNA mismatch endonuclease (patch repair protein)